MFMLALSADSPAPSDHAQSITGLRGGPMAMRFGVFDHIEPVPGQRLDQHLSRAAAPDRAPRRRRLPRLPPGRAPHAGHPQPGAVAERLPGRRGAAHAAAALRPLRLRAAAAPPAPPDRRDQHARQPQRRAAGDRRRPRRRDGSLLLGPGGRLRDELRALSRDAGHHARRAQPRPPHLQPAASTASSSCRCTCGRCRSRTRRSGTCAIR